MDATVSKKIFPCNTCRLEFEHSEAQRTHMREPWHVYNIKRRMADLPPIPSEVYVEKVATSLVSAKPKPLDAASSTAMERILPEARLTEERVQSKSSKDEADPITCCLFCNKLSESLDTNLEHMTSEHGLYIPEIEQLSSPRIMLGYLHTVINEYAECLYCGLVKQSAAGIQRHMLDKGHCMINLEREPELLEFWDLSDSDDYDTDDDNGEESVPRPRAQKISTVVSGAVKEDELLLPSGKVLGSKSKAREARRCARRIMLAAANETSGSTTTTARVMEDTDQISSAAPPESLLRVQTRDWDGTVAVRDRAGLIGVSDQRIRSLTNIQRKTQRQEAVVRASTAWAGELGGTHQKYSKVKMNLRAG